MRGLLFRCPAVGCIVFGYRNVTNGKKAGSLRCLQDILSAWERALRPLRTPGEALPRCLKFAAMLVPRSLRVCYGRSSAAAQSLSSRSWQTLGQFNYRRASQNTTCEAVQRDSVFLLSHNSSPKRLPNNTSKLLALEHYLKRSTKFSSPKIPCLENTTPSLDVPSLISKIRDCGTPWPTRIWLLGIIPYL